MDLFRDVPGRFFLVATLLPLIPVALLSLTGICRNLARPHRSQPGWAASVYWLLGGDQPLRLGAYLVFLTMLIAATCSWIGLTQFLAERNEVASIAGQNRWAERFDWIEIGASRVDRPATVLQLGYRIDLLTAFMVTMVTTIGTLIVLFAMGYMTEETQEQVTDHQVDHGHFHRRGRYSRFFLYIALFVFSMLNLLIADNLMQVFVGWELVGVCSFFLIGFYYERPSAGIAANKAFIMNRIGDAGFLIAIAIAWSNFGTLNIAELVKQFDLGRPAGMNDQLWTLMGLGLFLGCVGKSAQVPLHTWLPDAMEGPTPVSALIHAATMVAAGVYLVGRCFPLFSPDVLLAIAYTGAITLFVAATIATVMTDIKRVLAYSTVSQLGFMMLAMGVGGWTAGLFHLITHACFKALLFLGSGSVIHGLHHEQDMRKMGGLRTKMPITAGTMLVGVLAIAGAPFFSGWYSKDLILADVLGFGTSHQSHMILVVLPFITVGLTAFYMFRLWFLTFGGTARDTHVHDHAHESPWIMTIPLIILAVFSVVVGWGWPVWSPEESYLARMLHEAAPVQATRMTTAAHAGHHTHAIAGWLGLLLATAGTAVAVIYYSKRNPAEALNSADGPGAHFFREKWYFDALYARLAVAPVVNFATISAAADKKPTGPGEDTSKIDLSTLDGFFNAIGQSLASLGSALRSVQTGLIRRYVLTMVLTVVGVVGMLVALAW